MKISLQPEHLKRYKDLMLLFWKYGRSDFAQQFNTAHSLGLELEPVPDGGTSDPEQLAADLERMGPTYVKLGQVLSSRADLLPETYLRALSRLQDNVKPFPIEEVKEIVQNELGVRLSKGFCDFDPEPLAAASLGQVHRAKLRDGRNVVVKVQRPSIRQQIITDFEVLENIATFLDHHTRAGKQIRFEKILEEFERTLSQELDYTREAWNLQAIGYHLRDFPRIRIPQPIPDYTTKSVLTMEYISGQKITAIHPLARTELDGAGLAEELFQAYLKQVLVDGLFHADPHPGNIYVTDDHRIGLLDLGMVGRVTPGMQESLIRLLLAISEGRSEEAATLAIKISEPSEEFDETDFRRKIGVVVAEQRDNTLQDINIGRTLLQVTRNAGENGLHVSSELTLLGKTLLQLDEVGRILDPNFNPNASIRENVSEILNRHVRKSITSGRMFASVLEMKEFVGGLPNRLNKLLDTIGGGEFKVKVRPNDAHLLLDGVQKIANRITAGLVLAALIVGAALLMQVETPFRLFGYPGLAIICFLAAAGGGIWLLCTIFIHDRRSRKLPFEPDSKRGA